MEDEARLILRNDIGREPRSILAEAIRARIAPFGGVELELPSRELPREPSVFDCIWPKSMLLDTNVVPELLRPSCRTQSRRTGSRPASSSSSNFSLIQDSLPSMIS